MKKLETIFTFFLLLASNLELNLLKSMQTTKLIESIKS